MMRCSYSWHDYVEECECSQPKEKRTGIDFHCSSSHPCGAEATHVLYYPGTNRRPKPFCEKCTKFLMHEGVEIKKIMETKDQNNSYTLVSVYSGTGRMDWYPKTNTVEYQYHYHDTEEDEFIVTDRASWERTLGQYVFFSIETYEGYNIEN